MKKIYLLVVASLLLKGFTMESKAQGVNASISSQTNCSCYSSCDGALTITASGGTTPYTYSWSPGGGTSASINGLCAGAYTCTIKDYTGLSTSKTATITRPAIIVTTLLPYAVSCNGGANGSIYGTTSGGTGPFTYSWSPNTSTSSFVSGLTAGTYTCVTTDSKGCSMTYTSTVTQPPVLKITPSQTNITCNGLTNGSATATPSGGKGAYTFSWNAPLQGYTNMQTSLPVGVYTCTVVDTNSCSTSQTYTITQPAVLGLVLSGTNATCNGCDGKAGSLVTGGTSAYTYSWFPGGNTTPSPTALCAGTYFCHLTDANGCTDTASVKLSQAGPVVITGKVTAPVIGAINSGKVYLVRYNPVLRRQRIVDSVSISNGTYTFSGDSSAQYLVYALPDKAIYPNLFKAYSPHAPQWDSATVITAACATTDSANILLYELNPMTGSGTMAGKIKQDFGYVARLSGTSPIVLSPGDPVPGLDINLEQHPGGIIAHTVTDTAGKYHFGSVPAGEYQVLVDIPGLGMSSAYVRIIVTNQMYTNLNYLVDSMYIYPDTTTAFIATETMPVSSFTVSPNPFTDYLNVSYVLGTSSDVNLDLYNVLDEQLGTTVKLKQDAGSHQYLLRASDYNLPRGVYLLKITTEGSSLTRKVVLIR